eukprot:m.24496 g.24496  ORF g.24496 m.24496 type:complete len:290 (-) comp11519_c0_seq1:78-947(-)
MTEHHHHIPPGEITRATVWIVVGLFLLSVIFVADVTLSNPTSYSHRNGIVVRLLYLCYLIVFGLVLRDGSDHMQPSCLANDPEHCTVSFHYHVLFASVGWIIFATEGFLSWQGAGTWKHSSIKIYHVFMHVASFSFTLISVSIASGVHTFTGHPHLNTSHSWLGAFTLMLQAWQFVLGFYAFYIARDSQFKQSFVGSHRKIGLMVYVMAAATISMGLLEYSDAEALETVYSEARIRVHVAVALVWLIVAQVIFGTRTVEAGSTSIRQDDENQGSQIEMETLMTTEIDSD